MCADSLYADTDDDGTTGKAVNLNADGPLEIAKLFFLRPMKTG